MTKETRLRLSRGGSSRAATSTWRCPSSSAPAGTAFGTSRRGSGRCPTNSATSGFGELWPAARSDANEKRDWRFFRRFRPAARGASAATLRERAAWPRGDRPGGTHGLRPRRHDCRPVSFGSSLGPVQDDQGRDQDEYAARSQGKHPHLHPDHRGQARRHRDPS